MKTNAWLESSGNWGDPQCYYYFIDSLTGAKYCIYLRLRWGGNWSSELLRCSDKTDYNPQDVEGNREWDFLWDADDSVYMETSKKYSECECEELKAETLDIVKERFPGQIWAAV